MNWASKPGRMGFPAFLIVFAIAVPLRAQMVWHVQPDHPSDPAPNDSTISNPAEDGSEEAPFDAIQEAIDSAEDGDTVLLADGIYTGPGNRDIDFSGKAITVTSQNGPTNCIVDCELSGRGFSFVREETSDSVLEGITIRNGLADIFGDQFGGGIRCELSSPIIRNCIITLNKAVGLLGTGGAGGGIYCLSSHPIIERCRIASNSVLGFVSRGAGIFLESSSPMIVDSVIEGNTGSFGDLSLGGGIFCTGGSHPTLLRTILQTNKSAFAGGMVCQSFSNPKLLNCIIRNNIGQSTGGVRISDGSNPTFRNCIISGNIATFEGGGIDSLATTAPTITNSTIANNSMTGIGCLGGNPIIENCVVANNDDDLLSCVSSYSCVADGDAGVGNVSGDPLFVSEFDFHLDDGSPCIDAGDPDFDAGELTRDHDGRPRVLCGRVDIGAFESGIGDFDCDSEVDLFDFFEWSGCMTGPGGGPLDEGCVAFDFDADEDVDLVDVNGFWQTLEATMP